MEKLIVSDINPDFINLYLSKTSRSIKGIKIKDNASEYSLDELTKILSFITVVNDEEWSEDNILKAFKHYCDFLEDHTILNEECKNVENYNSEFIIMNKTNKNPLSYDCYMIYHYLFKEFYNKDFGGLFIKGQKIDTKSIKDVKQLSVVYLFSVDRENTTLESFYMDMIIGKNLSLLDLCASVICMKTSIYKNSFMSLKKEEREYIKNREYFILEVATKFRLDISFSENPYRDYLEIVNEYSISNTKDKNLKKLLNTSLIILNINSYFRSYFRDIYTEEDLKIILDRYKAQTSKKIISSLEKITSENHIFEGYIPNYPLEEFCEYGKKMNVESSTDTVKKYSYGCKNKYIYLSEYDILYHFKTMGCFNDFIDKTKPLSKYTMNIIDIIFEENEWYNEIKREIEEDLNYETNLKEYFKSDEVKNDKNILEIYLTKLFWFAMRIRSDKNIGSKEIVLSKDKANYNFGKDRENLYQDLIKEKKDISSLYQVLNERFRTLKTVDSNFCKTNGQKNLYETYLDITEGNDINDEVKSNSNYIIYSCCCYMKIFYQVEIIDVINFEPF